MLTRRETRSAQAHGVGGESTKPVVIWLIAIALFSPYTLAIFLGDLKFTPGKLLTTALVIPAIVRLVAGAAVHRRRLIAADLLAVLVTVLMVTAPVSVSGSSLFVSAASQALEFFGSYVIGRAFFFGGEALRILGRSLIGVLAVVTALAILDVAMHHFVVAEALVAIFHPPGGALDGYDPHFHRMVFGFDLLRATSTFDHPILYGSFCALTAAILAYSPLSPGLRAASLAVCALGGLLALSSAPILALAIVASVGCYDAALRRVRWRWKALMIGACCAVGLLCALSDSPLTWMIRHLTFDPSTGYFRLLMWDEAFAYIGSHAWTGTGFQATGNFILDNSVDSLWLGKTLNYGLPGVCLLFLLGISVIVPTRGQGVVRGHDGIIDRLCTGFSLTIVLFDVIGLTVYFWNAIWLYYGLCLGIRGTLKEYCWLQARRRLPAPVRRPAPHRARSPALPSPRRAPA